MDFIAVAAMHFGDKRVNRGEIDKAGPVQLCCDRPLVPELQEQEVTHSRQLLSPQVPLKKSLNFPLSSASSQMMNKAPPSLYSSDSRMRGTFRLRQVSDRKVLSDGSLASQGETPS